MSSSLRIISIDEILLPNDDDVGIIQHIGNIIVLLILLPLSIVVSILGVIISLFGLIILGILRLLNSPPIYLDDDGGLGSLLIVVFLFVWIGAPIFVIQGIFRNISGIFDDLLDPFLPNPEPQPTSAPNLFRTHKLSPSRVPTIEQQQQQSQVIQNEETNPRDPTNINILSSRVSDVLHSPMDTIMDIVMVRQRQQQQQQQFLDMNEVEQDGLDCEVQMLYCHHTDLWNVLLF